ncbi:MAG: hypothetical protein ACI4N3_01490 [Alphaproteobacteria bacterium]
MSEKDIKKKINRIIKQANNTPIPEEVKEEIDRGLTVYYDYPEEDLSFNNYDDGFYIEDDFDILEQYDELFKEDVIEDIKEMDMLAGKSYYMISPITSFSDKLSKYIPSDFKGGVVVNKNHLKYMRSNYINSRKKNFDAIVAKDNKYYNDTILPLIKKCSKLFVDLNDDKGKFEALRKDKLISTIRKKRIKNMRRNIHLFEEAKKTPPEQFFLNIRNFGSMDIGLPKEFIHTYYELHEKLKERPLIKEGYLSADLYRDRIKGYYDQTFKYGYDETLEYKAFDKQANKNKGIDSNEYYKILIKINRALFSNIDKEIYTKKKAEYFDGLYTYIYKNHPEERENILNHCGFDKDDSFVKQTVDKYKKIRDEDYKKYPPKVVFKNWNDDKFVPLELSMNIVKEIALSNKANLKSVLLKYKDEILELKKHAVNYIGFNENIDLKVASKEENIAFNKVMHKKSMFDEGSIKLEVKSKKSSKGLSITRGDEGR